MRDEAICGPFHREPARSALSHRVVESSLPTTSTTVGPRCRVSSTDPLRASAHASRQPRDEEGRYLHSRLRVVARGGATAAATSSSPAKRYFRSRCTVTEPGVASPRPAHSNEVTDASALRGLGLRTVWRSQRMAGRKVLAGGAARWISWRDRTSLAGAMIASNESSMNHAMTTSSVPGRPLSWRAVRAASLALRDMVDRSAALHDWVLRFFSPFEAICFSLDKSTCIYVYRAPLSATPWLQCRSGAATLWG
jgi:hypothetical protein